VTRQRLLCADIVEEVGVIVAAPLVAMLPIKRQVGRFTLGLAAASG
jgi:hypothetical protein